VTEVERIRAEYASRDQRLRSDLYAITSPYNLFVCQQKGRVLLKRLAQEGLIPLAGKRILDVGCGDGHHLIEFVMWGADRSDLAGLDLLDHRVARARTRIGCGDGGGGPDLRSGDASHLPWPSGTFDIVNQGTVFTSILDPVMKRDVAREMVRVLKPGGVVVWYDFRIDNPWNRQVKGVSRREIHALFPECRINLRAVTLAPPIGRRSVSVSWIGSLLLEKLSILNTHYLGIIRKPE
jgi:ubiquinone/menaquinone biosynthesis C-methylase UbiE